MYDFFILKLILIVSYSYGYMQIYIKICFLFKIFFYTNFGYKGKADPCRQDYLRDTNTC